MTRGFHVTAEQAHKEAAQPSTSCSLSVPSLHTLANISTLALCFVLARCLSVSPTAVTFSVFGLIMKSHTLGLSAALALAAPSAAFLIPSTLDGVVPDREFNLIDTSSQLLTLDCPSCPFAGSADEDLVWVQGIENSLVCIPHA